MTPVHPPFSMVLSFCLWFACLAQLQSFAVSDEISDGLSLLQERAYPRLRNQTSVSQARLAQTQKHAQELKSEEAVAQKPESKDKKEASEKEEAKEKEESKDEKEASAKEEAKEKEESKDKKEASEKEKAKEKEESKDKKLASAKEEAKETEESKDKKEASEKEEAKETEESKDKKEASEKEEAKETEESKDKKEASEKEEAKETEESKDKKEASEKEEAKEKEEVKESEEKETEESKAEETKEAAAEEPEANKAKEAAEEAEAEEGETKVKESASEVPEAENTEVSEEGAAEAAGGESNVREEGSSMEPQVEEGEPEAKEGAAERLEAEGEAFEAAAEKLDGEERAEVEEEVLETEEKEITKSLYYLLVGTPVFLLLHGLICHCIGDSGVSHAKHQGHFAEDLSDHYTPQVHSGRSVLGRFLESTTFKCLIVFLILADLTLSSILMSITFHLTDQIEIEQEMLLRVQEFAEKNAVIILECFVVEQILHAIAFGRLFWAHKWSVFDALIVYVTLVAETVFALPPSLGLIIVLRIWKLFALIWSVLLVRHETNELQEKIDERHGSPGQSRFTSLGDYSNLPYFPDQHHHDLTRTLGLERLLGPDAPVLLLPWCFFSLCLLGTALMYETMMIVLSLALCFGLTIAFFIFSSGRGRAWTLYSFLCFFSTALGAGIGFHHRFAGKDDLLTTKEIITVFVLIIVYFFVMAGCSMILPRWGVRLVGSSAAYAREFGWGWNPEMQPHLHFGWDRRFGQGADLVQERVHPRTVAIGLLSHRRYWSGEPVLDYAFFACNESSFLACILSHPVNPYGAFERIMVLINVIPLIVFPVALNDMLFEDHAIPKTLANIMAFVLPRALLKAYVKELCAVSDEIVLNHKGPDDVFPDLVALRKAGNADAALNHEISFFVILCNATLCISACIALFIQSFSTLKERPYTLSARLWEAGEGVMYAFVLELLLAIILPHKHDGHWVFGFFGQWWSERLKPEYGGKRGAPMRGSLPTSAMIDEPAYNGYRP